MPSDIPARFRAVRRHLGLTQEAIGHLIGVTKQSVSGYESGAARPDRERLERVLAPYGIDVTWLFTGRGEMMLPPAGAAPPLVRLAREAPPATPSLVGPVLFYVVDDDGRRIGAVRPYPEYVALGEPPAVHYERMLGGHRLAPEASASGAGSVPAPKD